MNLRRSEPIGFNISIWFLLSLGFLMFRSNGLAVYALWGALIHELGHILAIFASGCRVSCVSFGVGGVRLALKGEPTKGKSAVILLSGCAANIFAVGAAAVFGGASIGKFIFIGANLLLCLLNILPHSSLDGGKLLRLIFEKKAGSGKILLAADVAVLFFLTLAGALIFIRGGKNPTALLLAVCLIAKLPVFGKKNY